MGPPLIELSVAVQSKILCSAVGSDYAVWTAPVLIKRGSRASEYRCHCSSRVWSANRIGRDSFFFRAGPCGQTQIFFQGWAPPLPLLDGASVLVLHLDRWLIIFLGFVFTRTLRWYSILVIPEKSIVCSFAYSLSFLVKSKPDQKKKMNSPCETRTLHIGTAAATRAP